jgi:thioredoxin-related protein
MRFFVVLFLLISSSCLANDTTRHLYNPYANVEKDISKAVAKAKMEKKNVLIQVGGNWCIWCYKFNSFVQLDSTLKRTINNNFIVYHLNYSKENRNLEYMRKLGNPQRFGFPVFVILDESGNRLHTQDSSLLEKGNGYDFDKVRSFLENWSPKALMPESEEKG